MANDAELKAAKTKRAATKAAEKQANARFHLLQQKQRLIHIVEQRLSTLSYIQTAHDKSSTFWLSSVLITPSDIARYSLVEIPASKCLSYYYLCISLDKLLERFTYGTNCHAHTKLQNLSQLFEEWEYNGGSTAVQSMRLVMAKHATSIHPSTPPQQLQSNQSHSHIAGVNKQDPKSSLRSSSSSSTTEAASTQDSAVRTNIFKFNGSAVFEHLLTPSAPIDLCYSDVIVGLCSSLQGMYSLFSYQEEDYWRQNALFDSFMKLDKRIKEVYVTICMKELTIISSRTSDEAFDLIRSGIP